MQRMTEMSGLWTTLRLRWLDGLDQPQPEHRREEAGPAACPADGTHHPLPVQAWRR
ncbi:hypothetical protein SAMN04487779_10011133 [Belnapia rosea]|uniref:Uncharacterized protein n=2 Tax=Belnapia rosea TaxID=938405 RepID=A0A1G6M8N5_9PROT|nr:hypothetical protein SAMN04487779_10011133 [Belnapia rosea]